MPQLIVMRHAKSDWDTNTDDHARPLNARGRRSARAVGEFLAAADLVPQLAWTSTAVRARTTLELAIEAGGWDTRIEAVQALYGTGVERALEVVSRTPADVDRVMVVGHEPTWTHLIRHLTDATVAVRTATVVGIDLRDPFEDVGEHLGTIDFVLQARHLGA